MIRRDACVACGAQDSAAWPAVVAPFVAERVGLAPDRCRLLECRRCSHRFFDLALDDDEAERLYADYRGAAYVEVRRRWEPWYSEGLNAAGAAPATIEARRRLLRDYLRPLLPPSVLTSGGILDYGGDRGQFIPPDLGGARYVFDISGQPTHEGVLRVSQAGSLPLHRYDVVMLSHVLEHLTDPLDFLRRLPGHLGPRSAGHWLYVEVPHERFGIWKRRAREGGAQVGAAPRRGLPWLARDFYSTLFRSKLGVVPPLGVIKLHEHQGFFTVTSLRTLLGRAGYAVVDSRVTSSGCSAPYRRVLRVLARHEGEVAHASPDPQGEPR